MNNLNIQSAIAAIKSGTPEEVKQAQKIVDRFWHTIYIPNREEGKKILSAFLDELEVFGGKGVRYLLHPNTFVVSI